MPNIQPAPDGPQIRALRKLGIFTVTDLCRYADAHGLNPSELLRGTDD